MPLTSFAVLEPVMVVSWGEGLGTGLKGWRLQWSQRWLSLGLWTFPPSESLLCGHCTSEAKVVLGIHPI